MVADNLPSMTADEIHEYRIQTPVDVKAIIQHLWKNNTRYKLARRSVSLVNQRPPNPLPGVQIPPGVPTFLEE